MTNGWAAKASASLNAISAGTATKFFTGIFELRTAEKSMSCAGTRRAMHLSSWRSKHGVAPATERPPKP